LRVQAGIHLATVVANRDLGHEAWLLRLRQPDIAAGARPGQFVGVRVSEPGTWDPLLRRPFSVMRSCSDENGRLQDFDLLHVIVGRGTRAMSRFEVGDQVEVLGPLGNGFFDDALGVSSHQGRIVIAAGGVGVAPFFGVIEQLVAQGRREDVVVLFGARTRGALCAVEELRALDVRLELSTDDGTEGHRGLVTEVLERVLTEAGGSETIVLACGPDPMMRATARVAALHGARCLVSLENAMPCGFGACYGCVVHQPAREGRPARYARACVEGPIFPAERLGWDR
jgi:dihydroorotate dehydrogenase electron transfer subunit